MNHVHQFEWSNERDVYACKCGAIVTLREIGRRYALYNNFDFDLRQAARLIAEERGENEN